MCNVDVEEITSSEILEEMMTDFLKSETSPILSPNQSSDLPLALRGPFNLDKDELT